MTALRDILVEVIGGEVDLAGRQLDAAMTFADMGIDSLDMLAVADAVEKRFGIAFVDQDFTSMATFADLEAVVARHIALDHCHASGGNDAS